MVNSVAGYNDSVVARFNKPPHAGVLSPGPGTAHHGRAEESPRGPRVLLSCRIDSDRLTQLRFSAWGCPHLIAAAELLCEELELRTVAELDDYDIGNIHKVLAVPVEKTGRILMLEDALEALKASLSRSRV